MSVGFLPSAPPQVVGAAQLNLGSGTITAQAYINVFHCTSASLQSPATPANVDQYGYPVSNFSGGLMNIVWPLNGVWSTTGPWVLMWDAGRAAFLMDFLASATVSSHTNCTITNGAGSGNFTIQGDGANAGSVTFTWNSTTPGTCRFDGAYSGNYANNTGGNMALVRQSDLVAYNAGRYWTSEFIQAVKNLYPSEIRTMGWNMGTFNIDSNQTLWKYRTPILNFGYFGSQFFPSTWAGTASVSHGALTCAAPSDSPLSGWVDGEQIQATPASAVSSLTITNAVSNGGNVQLTVNSTTGLFVGNSLNISGIVGTTEANNTQTILSIDSSTTLTLNVAFVHAYVSGGTATCNIDALPITSIVSNGGFCQVTVPTTAGLSSGQKINIESVNGTTEANGYQTISSINSGTQFTTSVAFVNTYTGGGTVGYQTLAVTGKSGGAKLIVSNAGVGLGPFGTTITALIPSTFTYDTVLDVVTYMQGGIEMAPPLEVQCDLANKINCGLWLNTPTMASNDWILNALNVCYGQLNSWLKLTLEHGNEGWNFTFPGTQWMTQRATALGLSGGLTYQALRIRQIMGNIVPASSWGGAMTRINRVYAFQGGTGTGDTTITSSMKGTALVSPGSAAYQAFVGGASVNYNMKPGRPIDVCEGIAYAPYITGPAVCGQSVDVGSVAPTAADAAMLQSVIDNTNNSNFAAATALIDANIRTGNECSLTVTASGTTFTTPTPHGFSNTQRIQFVVSGGTTYSGLTLSSPYRVTSTPTGTTFTCAPLTNDLFGSNVNAGTVGTGTTSVGACYASFFFIVNSWYAKWEAVAASFDSDRPSGMPNLIVKWYEGALEPSAPTTAQCTAIGLVSPNPGGTAAAAATVLAQAIINWKNDPTSAATIQSYYKAFMGTDPAWTTTFGLMPHSVAPSQLVLNGGGLYGLLADNNFTPLNPYQLYYGFQAFSAPPP